MPIKCQCLRALSSLAQGFLAFVCLSFVASAAYTQNYNSAASNPKNPIANFERLRFEFKDIGALNSLGIQADTLQDAKGYIWFAGDTGLGRYNGYEVKRYQMQSNIGSLTSSMVKDLMLDRDQQMWVAAGSHLHRYYEDFDYFDRIALIDQDGNDNIQANVEKLLEDHLGNIWVATGGQGVFRFRPGAPDNRKIRKALLNNIAPQANRVEFSYFKHQIDNQQSLISNNVSALLEDNKHRIWFGTLDKGVSRLDPSTGEFQHYRSDDGTLSHNHVIDFLQDSQGIIWLGTYGGGLNRYNPKSDRFETCDYDGATEYSNSSGTGIVWDISEDNEGNIWIATNGEGIYMLPGHLPAERRARCYGQDFKHYFNEPRKPGSLHNDLVRTIFLDNQDGLWLGHFPYGISRLNRQASAFRVYQGLGEFPNVLSNNKITAITEDAKQNLWVGTAHGFSYVDRKDGNFETKLYTHVADDPTTISAQGPISVLVDRQERVWIGTWRGGISRFVPERDEFVRYTVDPGTDRFIGEAKKGSSSDDYISNPLLTARPEVLSAPEVWNIYQDKRGTIWAGVRDLGLYYYQPEHDAFVPYTVAGDKFLDGRITAMFEDDQANFWLGGDSGLSLLDRDSGILTPFTHHRDKPNGMSQGTVMAIHQGQNGRMWFGTWGGGLNLLLDVRGRFKTFREQDGLGSNAVSGIIEDAKGGLWLATAKGISHFDIREKTFRNYSKRHGIVGNLHRERAQLMSAGGELTFGGTHGLTIFRAEDVTRNEYIPPVVLTDFQLLNRPVPVGIKGSPLAKVIGQSDEITLNYHQSVFSIEYAALNYQIPEHNQYAYRLSGFDQDWNLVGTRRRATYTNLDPGHYTFEVRASNNDGIWNQQGTAVNIIVLPPWWRTLWAYVSYALTLMILLAWFVRTQRQQVRYERQKAKHEREKVLQEQLLVDRLKQLDKLKDEFLANTSHELRTPLHGMIGLAESLADDAVRVAPQLNAEVSLQNLQMIVSSGKRLAKLVDDILDFSKLKNHELSLHFQAVDLLGEVEVVVALSRPLVDDADLVLENLIPNDLPLVKADENRLQQILYNLVGNAVKFTDKGKISVTAERRGDWIHISVRDTGIGVAPEKFDTIFSSFEQVSGEDNRRYSGTGLGLALTKRLVTLHGGEISVNSTLGEGSVFSFTLAVASQALSVSSSERLSPVNYGANFLNAGDKALAPVTHKVQPNQYSLKVLVVDDEPVNCQVLINYLGVEHYDIHVAQSGADALALVEREQAKPFDLVLLDVMMPQMSGYRVCEILRKQFSAQELPVIFLTAKKSVNDLVVGFNSGGNDFITKPVAKEELLARISLHRQLLESSRDLEQKVQQRTKALANEHKLVIDIQHQLVVAEKMAGLTTLVAGIAHEFNNPANMVQGSMYNQLLEINEFKQFLLALTDDEELQEVFRQRFDSMEEAISPMQEGTARITKLVKGLSLFSSLGEANYKQTNIASDLAALAKNAQVEYEQKVLISTTLGDTPAIPCYPNQLTQAISHILINACQATLSDRRKHRSRDQLSVVSLRTYIACETDRDYLVVEVKDEGVGMSDNTQKRMFEPFFTARGIGEGTGLGLAIAYGVIEQHQGKIKVDTKLGKGTTVSVYLPLSANISPVELEL